MNKNPFVTKVLIRTIIAIGVLILFMLFAYLAEASENITVSGDVLSPAPLLEILTKDVERDKEERFVILLKPLREEQARQILVVYLKGSVLITAIWDEGDEKSKKKGNEIYCYDVVIPPKKVREYYAQNGVSVSQLLEAVNERESRMKKSEHKK